MSALVDPVGALVAILKAQSTINTTVSGRVFGAELPAAETAQMPRECLVVKPAGGAQQLGGGYQQFTDERVDIFAYAPSPRGAYTLYTNTHLALKHLERTIAASTVIHWCRPAGGPMSLRDAKTLWPYVLSTWQMLYSEIPVAA